MAAVPRAAAIAMNHTVIRVIWGCDVMPLTLWAPRSACWRKSDHAVWESGAMPEELTAEQAATRLATADTLGIPLGPGQPPAFLRAR